MWRLSLSSISSTSIPKKIWNWYKIIVIIKLVKKKRTLSYESLFFGMQHRRMKFIWFRKEMTACSWIPNEERVIQKIEESCDRWCQLSIMPLFSSTGPLTKKENKIHTIIEAPKRIIRKKMSNGSWIGGGTRLLHSSLLFSCATNPSSNSRASKRERAGGNKKIGAIKLNPKRWQESTQGLETQKMSSRKRLKKIWTLLLHLKSQLSCILFLFPFILSGRSYVILCLVEGYGPSNERKKKKRERGRLLERQSNSWCWIHLGIACLSF